MSNDDNPLLVVDDEMNFRALVNAIRGRDES